MRITPRKLYYLLVFIGSLGLLFSLGSGVNGFDISTLSAWIFNASTLDSSQNTILYSIRLPRSLSSFLVGAGLGVSGVVIQALFRNPLAEPGLIGVSAGAALMSCAFIVLNTSYWSFSTSNYLFILPIIAFIGGLITTLIVIRVSEFASGATQAFNLLLAGIAVNAFAGAGISFFSYFAQGSELRTLNFWLLGSFSVITWHEFFILLIVVLPVIVLLLKKARVFNAILLGERDAKYLGVNVEKEIRTNIYLVALLVGVITSLCGVIAFIGLVIPHLMRLLSTADHRSLLPLSALGGGTLLMWSDASAKLLLAPAELPVGIITTLIGAPLFLYLIATKNNRQ